MIEPGGDGIQTIEGGKWIGSTEKLEYLLPALPKSYREV